MVQRREAHVSHWQHTYALPNISGCSLSLILVENEVINIKIRTLRPENGWSSEKKFAREIEQEIQHLCFMMSAGCCSVLFGVSCLTSNQKRAHTQRQEQLSKPGCLLSLFHYTELLPAPFLFVSGEEMCGLSMVETRTQNLLDSDDNWGLDR